MEEAKQIMFRHGFRYMGKDSRGYEYYDQGGWTISDGEKAQVNLKIWNGLHYVDGKPVSYPEFLRQVEAYARS